MPPGLKPAGNVGAGGEQPPAPTVPAETPPAPADAASAPADAAPAPAEATPGYTTNARGRKVVKVGDLDVVNYDGWLAPGEQPKQTASTVNGQTITSIASATGPEEMNSDVAKEFNYTKDMLTPAQYILKLKPSDVPDTWKQVSQAMATGTSFLTALDSIAMSDKDREYFTHLMNYTNARAHKSSGADVTKNDTATYNFLTSLVASPTPRDLRLLKNSVRENILNSRTGWPGRVPNETLRQFDIDLARRGLDLDVSHRGADGAPLSPDRLRDDDHVLPEPARGGRLPARRQADVVLRGAADLGEAEGRDGGLPPPRRTMPSATERGSTPPRRRSSSSRRSSRCPPTSRPSSRRPTASCSRAFGRCSASTRRPRSTSARRRRRARCWSSSTPSASRSPSCGACPRPAARAPATRRAG